MKCRPSPTPILSGQFALLVHYRRYCAHTLSDGARKGVNIFVSLSATATDQMRAVALRGRRGFSPCHRSWLVSQCMILHVGKPTAIDQVSTAALRVRMGYQLAPGPVAWTSRLDIKMVLTLHRSEPTARPKHSCMVAHFSNFAPFFYHQSASRCRTPPVKVLGTAAVNTYEVTKLPGIRTL